MGKKWEEGGTFIYSYSDRDQWKVRRSRKNRTHTQKRSILTPERRRRFLVPIKTFPSFSEALLCICTYPTETSRSQNWKKYKIFERERITIWIVFWGNPLSASQNLGVRRDSWQMWSDCTFWDQEHKRKEREWRWEMRLEKMDSNLSPIYPWRGQAPIFSSLLGVVVWCIFQKFVQERGGKLTAAATCATKKKGKKSPCIRLIARGWVRARNFPSLINFFLLLFYSGNWRFSRLLFLSRRLWWFDSRRKKTYFCFFYE